MRTSAKPFSTASISPATRVGIADEVGHEVVGRLLVEVAGRAFLGDPGVAS